MTRRALVTGGAGFIGSHLAAGLLDEGFAVRVLDDLSSGSRANLERLPGEVELFEGDVSGPGVAAEALREVELVFHEAALASVPQCNALPFRSNEVNVGGTLRVLEAARDAGCRRVVFASSCAVYGNDETQLPKHEGLRPQPISAYSLQKLASEQYCALLGSLWGLETVCLRYFNVYGPHQDPEGDYAAAIPIFLSRALAGQRVTIFGDGEQTRDFVFVSDVVEANLRAAVEPAAAGQVLNVAGTGRVSIGEVARLAASCAGREIEIVHAEAREGDVRHSWGDGRQAREILGFEARVGLEEGLKRTAEALASEAAVARER